MPTSCTLAQSLAPTAVTVKPEAGVKTKSSSTTVRIAKPSTVYSEATSREGFVARQISIGPESAALSESWSATQSPRSCPTSASLPLRTLLQQPASSTEASAPV